MQEATITAEIKEAHEVTTDGMQYVVATVVYNDKIVGEITVNTDVNSVEQEIESRLLEIKAKMLSEKKLSVGDKIEV